MKRKDRILVKVIENYIKEWSPVWSKFLNEMWEFEVSSATLRKEMNTLEKEWLLSHPYTSSWRIPTEKAYRAFIDNFESVLKDKYSENKDIAKKEFEEIRKTLPLKRAKDRVSEWLSILSKFTKNIVFATIPWNDKHIYIWISRILKQDEFKNDIEKTSSIIEVFEWWLIKKLNDSEVSDKVQVFIWEENIFEQFESCSMVAVKFNSFWYEWIVWILWSMRMKYAYNIAMLEEVKSLIEWDDYVKKLN